MSPLVYAGILLGGLLFGAGIVGILAFSRRWIGVSGLLGACSFAFSVALVGVVIQSAQRPAAVTLAASFLVVGVLFGYLIGAALLSQAADHVVNPPLIPRVADDASGIAVVILAAAEPERYDLKWAATRLAELTESGGLRIPMTATPFVFAAERARYRAARTPSAARPTVRATVERVAAALARHDAEDIRTVTVAWCDGTPTLVQAVANAASAGIRTVVVASLTPDPSYFTDIARRELEASRPDAAGVSVVFAPLPWNRPEVADRLVERVLDAAGDDLSSVGIVLVSQGQPERTQRQHVAWAETQNYLEQRVRMLLAASGLDETHVRSCFLEWQLPDVTEAVRHAAALGCTRVVVAPSTIAAGGLATLVDLRHAISVARVESGVVVVTITPWGDDMVFVEAVASTILEARQETHT